MTITIPSYKRAGKVTTLDFLGDAFTKDEIIIGTQSQEDYEAYTSAYGERATVIFKEGHCCGDNRNNLLEWCQQHGITETLQLDDDIRHVVTMYKQKLRGAEFRQLMERCFDICHKNDIVMFGGYCCENPLMMSKTAKRNIIVGMLCGILDTTVRFDKKFQIKHDYELSLRLMQQGRRVVRFNSFAVAAAHRSAGGCSDGWNRPDYQAEADWLVEAYPTLVAHHSTRKGEIKFIG